MSKLPRPAISIGLTLYFAAGCTSKFVHGDIGSGFMAPLGQQMPDSTEEQRETFRRGKEVALRRFELSTGLGPAFNLVSCAGCHERPQAGGSAGLYRNFFLTGFKTPDGAFFPGTSAGPSGGVLRMYAYSSSTTARPAVPETTTIIAQRNPIPIFGTGLIAELPEASILAHADPDDADGDGVSGRANFEQGFVGRFGRKAQTASVEGFIRGPLFNHLGITSAPLTDEQRARLPVDSSSRTRSSFASTGLSPGQAAVNDAVLTDLDGVPDPELPGQDLFDVVSFAMLLGVAQVEERSPELEESAAIFDQVGCAVCHVPRLEGPRGPIPIYSDLLLHDLGPELADGIEQGLATGAEFRTQPLWSIAAVAPYLHDGRARSLEEAIRLHGGEAAPSRDRLLAQGPAAMDRVVEFLRSLGARDQISEGLLAPGATSPAVGEYGGPLPGLDAADLQRFEEGRRLFDRDFGLSEGVGAPRFNGDSCRACHFDPVLGGAGPRDVNVMRHGIKGPGAEFVAPFVGSILHKETALQGKGLLAQPEAQIFEHRQTPHLFGLGLIDRLPDAVILANADPLDERAPQGISGKPAWTDDHRLGRFGHKAQVPSVVEFVRDAVSAELGLTIERQEGLTFGRLHDDDGVPDPELPLAQAETLAFFLRQLGPPPRQSGAGTAAGAEVFERIGCAACHIPSLSGPDGPVPLYSDLLLHEILAPEQLGIEDGSAGMRELRTTPLWGLAKTAPYWHSGEADTITQAIELHAAEGQESRDRFRALSQDDQRALLGFLESL